MKSIAQYKPDKVMVAGSDIRLRWTSSRYSLMNEKEIMTVKQVSEPRSFKMYYVYLLKNSKNRNIYIGWTQDLKRRYVEHKDKNNSWELIYYEAYIAKEDAQIREKQLKQYGSSLGHLKRRIKNCLRKGGANG